MMNIFLGTLLVLIPFTVLSLQILLRPRGRFLHTLPVILLAIPYIVILFLTEEKLGFAGFMGYSFRWTQEKEKELEKSEENEEEE